MTAELTVPESVLAYATDPALRTAVDTLLDDGLPPGLEQKDLAQYYQAELAARRFLADWGIFGTAVWEASWQIAFEEQTRWSPWTATDVADAGWSVVPSELRLVNGFPFFGWVHGDDGGKSFYTGIALDRQSHFRMFISTDVATTSPFATSSVPYGPFEQDKNENWMSCPIMHLQDGFLNPAPLLAAARDLVAFLNGWVPPRRARSSAE